MRDVSGDLSIGMLTHRSQRWLVIGVMAAVSLYLVLPLVASFALAQGLRQFGYKNVIVQLGYPGWDTMRVPVVSFQQDLGSERFMVSLTDAEIRYRVAQLLKGHVDRVSLPYVAMQILNAPSAADGETVPAQARADRDESPWSLLTAGDLLRRLPLLPFDELRLDRVTIFREQATGPLRKVTISGVVMQREGELGGHLSFQGQETASYGLTVTGHSASTWSATLVSQRPQAVPILSWQSQAHPDGAQVRINGRLEVNVRELAPFIALLVPIGPELGKVTGHIAVTWSGVAATDASLTSLWEDPRTHIDGTVQLHATLPALRGIAKEIAVDCDGTFAGNATQLGWTLNPGVLVTATVNVQPQIIPEAVRMVLPKGDQPVRIDHAEPVKGMLYWSEVPVRTVAEGPLHVVYGATPGPLVAEFEATRAEGLGAELVLAEGTYRVEGILPTAVTDLLSAKEATGGFQGTVTLARTHVKGVLLPTSSVTARQIERGSVAIPRVTLQLSDALPVQCDLASSRCQAGPATVGIRLPAIRVMGRELRLAQSLLVLQQVETTGSAWNVSGTVTAAGAVLEAAPWGLAATDWRMKFAANQAGIKADIHVDAPAQAKLLAVKLEQPFSGAQGSLHGTLGPVTFDGQARRLGALVTGLPASADLTDGRVSATVDLSWTIEAGDLSRGIRLASGAGTVVADNLAGRFQDYAVTGLSSTVALRTEGSELIVTAQPAALTIAAVQTGVEISNVSVMWQLAWKVGGGLPVIELKDFQCDVFGGSVTSPGLRVDPAQPPYRATVSLRNLDLAQVLSVEQQKGLQGTGVLNGTLPITATAEGVTVVGGTVEAQPPGGVIRYATMPESAKLITESDGSLRLVAQALINFHYTVLRVGVEYDENGILDLTARLEGHNPDLKKSPPIHFNLNVQEHVPTLLKSLRRARDLEEAVQRREGDRRL